ncbi:MAG: glycosyltransferase family 2 protein [Candidatus Omnitrophica bacterium]|nr:glycosyltransferase family 2 protein [Candidatus Omnitrophota bacterium]
MTPSQPKILIIIPAYNERANIRNTLKEIWALDVKTDVIVIDDGSKDATAQEARQAGAKVISLPFNLGIGGAVQTGFQFASQNDYDIAIQVDADGQHDVGYIRTILSPVLNNESDIVIGSRFMPQQEKGYRSSFARRLGIGFFVRLIGVLTGSLIYDPTSGFRAYNKKMIRIFARHYPHDFPEPEAIVLAGKFGAKIKELPVVMRKRQGGESSIRYLKSLYYMVKVTFAILLDMLKTRRLVEYGH